MLLRPLHPDLEDSLVNNDPYIFYHLIKFERPKPTLQDGSTTTSATDYTYITDAPFNVDWNDGSGNGVQTYIANRVMSVGNIQETDEARATTTNIKLATTALGTTVSWLVDISSGVLASQDDTPLDFVAEGFREGDKLEVYTDQTYPHYCIITGFETNEHTSGLILPNSIINFTNVAYADELPTSYTGAATLTVVSEELNTIILQDKNSTLFSNYINRDVYIYRVHAEASTGDMIGTPWMLFKGIISQGSIEEKPDNSSSIVWGLTSHWGDFIRVQGRYTSDSFHRAIDLTGRTDRDALLKPEYEFDFGFMHAERSVNAIAKYYDKETRYRTSSSWGGFRSKTRAYEVTVERPVDLRFDLQAKYLPVVYGVRKISGNPVFVDIPYRNSERNNVYTVNALCEGEIAAVYDIYIDGEPSVCLDGPDALNRNPQLVWEVSGSFLGLEKANLSEIGSVDVLCMGRADRGDVLEGIDFVSTTTFLNPGDASLVNNPYRFGGTFYNIWGANDNWVEYVLWWVTYVETHEGKWPTEDEIWAFWRGQTNNEILYYGDRDGITHEQFVTFMKPSPISYFFQAGLTDQNSSVMILHKANEAPGPNPDYEEGFKIQRSYFEGSIDDYWGPSHRLADTAHIDSVFTLTAENSSLPDQDYVVKGKYVRCYNYDYSYAHNTNSNYDTEDASNFSLGQVVRVFNSSGRIYATSTVNIVDKWLLQGPFGEDDYRFKLIADGDFLDLYTEEQFYITDDNDTPNYYWHMYSDAHEVGFGDVTAIVPEEIANATPGTDVNGRIYITIELNSGTMANILDDVYDAGIPNIKISFYDSNHPNLCNYVFAARTWTSATKELQIIPSQYAYYAISNWVVPGGGGSKIFFSNAVKTTSISGVSHRHTVNVTRTINNVPYTITKDIVANTTSTYNVLFMRGAYPPSLTPGLDNDNGFIVKTPVDTYSIRPNLDRRVSLNPSMQLLDYLTAKVYGRGLNIDEDINLETFKEAARLCDDKSKIKVAVVNIGSLTVGDVYKYTAGSTFKFQGTVSAITPHAHTTYTTLYEVEFDNIIGKLGRKWTDWYSKWIIGDIVWGFDKVKILIEADIDGITGKVAEATIKGASTPDISLSKVSGSGPAILDINTTRLNGLYNTNSVVRGWTQGDEWSSPGYSLHDSDDVKYWKYLGWDEPDQRYVTRHQLNQLINTSEPLFDNINKMLSQFNGLLRYANGKYELEVKTGAPTDTDPYWVAGITILSEDDIIGNIKLDDKGQKNSYNKITTNVIDPQNKFEARAITFTNSNYLKQDKGIPKEGQLDLPGITNYYSARTNIIQFLDESRYGLTISFTMDQKGVLLLPGNIIALSYKRFNWELKHFRIQTLTLRSDGLVSVVAKEHNDNAYLIDYTDRSPVEIVAPPIDPGPPKLEPPTNLTATTDLTGEIRLNWVNSDTYSQVAQKIEIWGVECARDTAGNYIFETDGITGTGNDYTLASLLDITSGNYWVHNGFEEALQHVWFYWIRYVQPSTASNTPTKYSIFEPLSVNPGVQGSCGSAAVQGYTFYWTNQTVQLIRDSLGNIADTSPTAFEFAIYKGQNKLEAVPPATPPGAGQWSLTLTGNANITPDSDPYNSLSPLDDVVRVGEIEYIGSEVTFEQIKIDLNIEGTVWTPSLYQSIYVIQHGFSAWDIIGSNLEHIFMCDQDGVPFVNDFSCVFQVGRGGTTFTYDDSTFPAENTYHYENITCSTNLDDVTPGDMIVVAGNGTITLNGASPYLDAGPIPDPAWINVPIYDHLGSLIYYKVISLKKMYSGIRGGQEFILYAPADISEAYAAIWAADPFSNDTVAQAVADAVINHPLNQDGFIRPNDRITVSAPDDVPPAVGTRIYEGVGTDSSTTINANYFSTLVVHIFHGSVIVDGTLSADALVADFVIANNARVASNLVIGNQADTNIFGQLYSYQKTSFNDTSPGFFMDAQGYFAVGDGQYYMKFEPGGTLEIKGNLVAGGNYNIALWLHGDDVEVSPSWTGVKKIATSPNYTDQSWVRTITNIATGSTASLTPSGTTTQLIFGLSETSLYPDPPGASATFGEQIAYGFILNPSDSAGTLDIWEYGLLTSPLSETYVAGDLLRVIYDGSNVHYYRNDDLLYTTTGVAGQGAFYWEGNWETTTASYSTLGISFIEAQNPKGLQGVAGASMFAITEPIPDAKNLSEFNEFISINGIDSGGSGGINGVIGREYAVKGDICIVKDYPHPDAGGVSERVSAFICTYEGEWTENVQNPYTWWVPPGAFIDGDLVVDGTIHGKALTIYGDSAGDAIQIGPDDKERIDIYADGNLRVRLGDLVST